MSAESKKVYTFFSIFMIIVLFTISYISFVIRLNPRIWIPLAIVDSINPCEIAIQVTLGASLALTHSISFGFLSVFLYASGVVTTYYLLGLGIYYIMVYIPTWLAGTFAILYGSYNLLKGAYRPAEDCPECVERGKMGLKYLRWGLIGPYLLGLIIGATISPCTLGPYPIFLTMIKEFPLIHRLISLLGYNLIFGLPLFLISFGFAFFEVSPRAQLLVVKNYKKIKIVSSLLMIAVGFYIIYLFRF